MSRDYAQYTLDQLFEEMARIQDYYGFTFKAWKGTARYPEMQPVLNELEKRGVRFN